MSNGKSRGRAYTCPWCGGGMVELPKFDDNRRLRCKECHNTLLVPSRPEAFLPTPFKSNKRKRGGDGR